MKYIKYLLVLFALNIQAINYTTPAQTTNIVNSLLSSSYVSRSNSVNMSGPLSIGQLGTNADSNAQLDIYSTNKGILIPRIALITRDAIVNPATGLLVFVTNTVNQGFYYYTGTNWVIVGTGASTNYISLTNSDFTFSSLVISNTNNGSAFPQLILVSSNNNTTLEIANKQISGLTWYISSSGGLSPSPGALRMHNNLGFIPIIINSNGIIDFSGSINITSNAIVSGYLGVGVASMTNKVDVNGIIGSRSGGFAFPDGTVQTTAASGSGTNGTNLAQAFIGYSGATNLITIDTNGWIIFQGNARPWSKMTIPVYQMGWPTNTAWQAGKVEGIVSNYVILKDAATNVLYFDMQLPPDIAEGTDIYAKVNWGSVSSMSGANAILGFSYALARRNEAFTYYSSTNTLTTANAAYINTGTDLSGGLALTPQTYNTIYSFIHGSIYRLGDHTSDDYAAGIVIYSIDLFYQKNTLGTSGIYSGGK